MFIIEWNHYSLSLLTQWMIWYHLEGKGWSSTHIFGIVVHFFGKSFFLIVRRDVGSGSGKGQPVWAWYRIGRNCGHCTLLDYTPLWLYRLPTNEPTNQPTSLPTGLASWFQPPYQTLSFIPSSWTTPLLIHPSSYYSNYARHLLNFYFCWREVVQPISYSWIVCRIWNEVSRKREFWISFR